MPIPSSVLARPEHRALLRCACFHSERSKTGFLALLEGLDWDYFRPRLLHNGLIALFSHQVQGAEAQLPDAMQRLLEREFSQGLQRRLTMVAELQSLVAFLESHNVRVLAYKGPILAHLAYGSLAMRPFSDLDLLIAPADKAAVVALLETRGYLPDVEAIVPASLQAKRQLRDYELALLPTTGVGALDVHWAVAPPYDGFPLEFEALWRRRSASVLPSVATFCREDLLLTLCAHGLKHRWNRLEWIGCVLALLQSRADKPLDWEQIEATAQELGSGRSLRLGLQLAWDLAACDAAWNDDAAPGLDAMPPKMRHAVARDRVVTRLAEQVWTTIFERENPHDDDFITITALRFALRARQGWRAKWAYFWAINRAFLVPNAEDTAWHGADGPLAYFSRFGRLILRRMHRLLVLRRL